MRRYYILITPLDHNLKYFRRRCDVCFLLFMCHTLFSLMIYVTDMKAMRAYNVYTCDEYYARASVQSQRTVTTELLTYT